MPIARTAVGCLVAFVLLVGALLLVRPLIFSVAPPRDDGAVVVASAAQVANGPVLRPIVLSRSRSLLGEQALDAGRVQVSVVAGRTAAGVAWVVNAASPVAADCPVEIEADRLVDCEGRAWAYGGEPIDPGLPPLQRFATEIREGAVIADLTAPLDPGT
jgi:hypothetical protein